ncbi:MAG: hypothetical protein ACFFCS_13805 [Candidatus Hodarchaeota archaeon]
MTEQNQRLTKPVKEDIKKPDYRGKKKRKRVITFIKKLSNFLNIPERIALKAINMYDEASNKQLFQWREVKAIGGSCLYATCKMEGIPRSLSEFLGYFDGSGEKRLYECLKILASEFNFNTRMPDPLSLLKHYSKLAGFPPEVTLYGYQLLDNILLVKKIQGKDPNGYIAACLYHACKVQGLKFTQEKMATMCKVNTSTLRKRLREIAKLAKF